MRRIVMFLLYHFYLGRIVFFLLCHFYFNEFSVFMAILQRISSVDLMVFSILQRT